MNRVIGALLFLAAAGQVAAGAPAARADDRPLADTGVAAPVGSLLERVRQDFEGDILEVELEREDERENGADQLIYEVKVLTPRGRVLELVYDAHTLELIEAKGERDRDPRRGRDEDEDDDDED